MDALRMRAVTLTNNLYSIFKRCVHFLYRNLIEPRSVLEDQKRHEFILNIILVTTIGVLLLFGFCLFAVILTRDIYNGMSLGTFGTILFFFLGLYALSRKNKYILASYLLVGLFLIVTGYCAYTWGIDVPVAILGSFVLILISSILINSRFAVFITLILCSITFSIGYLQLYGIIPIQNYWRFDTPQLSDLIEQSVVLVLIMVLSWLANRELEKSLGRARQSEQNLKEERDLLEIKVEDRTKELKRIQGEKISQLYRFAEFGRLSSGMFHDLINPLTAASLQINELAKDPTKLAQTKKHVDKAITASKRMQQFIHALQKQISVQHVERQFSLNEEIEEAIELLNYKARCEKIEILFSATENVAMYGNPISFHQMVVNLISNAIDSYDNNDVMDRRIIIQLKQDAHTVIVSVSDQGCGIALEIINYIFDPFFTTKSFHKGTGIGLSQTKSIIEKYFQGTIAVNSFVGKGSTFTLIIPKKRDLQDTTVY